jgi:hypothetical protein
MIVWRSVDGVWRVEAREVAGTFEWRIERHGAQVGSGTNILPDAVAAISRRLVELGGPPLSEMVER